MVSVVLLPNLGVITSTCPSPARGAHRTLILRKLKGLESLIDVSVVSYLMLENGWTFDKSHGSTGDKLDHFDFMHQRYTADTADYTGRVAVPVLGQTTETHRQQ